MLKEVVVRPEWIAAKSVKDIYSVSNCVSGNFADYIKFWRHNGFWFFNSPQQIIDLVAEEHIQHSAMTWFYYEFFESEFHEDTRQWSAFSPEPSFLTKVVSPQERTWWATMSPPSRCTQALNVRHSPVAGWQQRSRSMSIACSTLWKRPRTPSKADASITQNRVPSGFLLYAGYRSDPIRRDNKLVGPYLLKIVGVVLRFRLVD